METVRTEHTKTPRNEQLRGVFAVYYILGELWKPYPIHGIQFQTKAVDTIAYKRMNFNTERIFFNYNVKTEKLGRTAYVHGIKNFL